MSTFSFSRILPAALLGLGLLLTACGGLPLASPTPPPTDSPQPALGSISGSVWEDVCLQDDGAPGPDCAAPAGGGPRADGVLQAGEPGFGGVVVNLGLGCPAAPDITTTTNPDGTYTFTGLPAGTYCLTVDPALPANAALRAGLWTWPALSAPGQPASHLVQLGQGETKSNVNFGRDTDWTAPLPTATATASAVPATASPTVSAPTPTRTSVQLNTPPPTPTPTATPSASASPTRTPTPTVTHTPSIVNWRGEYYGNRDFSGSPLVRDDAALDFNWGTGAPAGTIPADGFAVRWTRTLQFNAGTYRFHALADDGVRVWIDDQLVVDDWKDGGFGEVTAEIALAQSAHSLKVEYYEAAGVASFKLWWETVGTPGYPDWKGEYWSNRSFSGAPALTRNDRTIDFDWGSGAAAAGLPADEFAVRWSRWLTFEAGLYRFTARADDGLRLYLDGQVIVDEWHASDAAVTYRVDVPVTAGPHSLLVEYDERSFRALVKVGWERLPATATPTTTWTATGTATATPTATGTSVPSNTPTATSVQSSTPTATPTVTATRSPLEATVGGRVWRDVCAATGQEWTGPGNLPAGCVVADDSTLLANGLLEADETGIGGVLVTLTEGACGTGGIDPHSFTQTTDTEGRFTFTGLTAGLYCLTSSPAFPQNAPILLPGLWTQPRQADPGTLEAAISVSLTAGEVKNAVNLGWDFLNLP
jgi:hypothetical protein